MLLALLLQPACSGAPVPAGGPADTGVSGLPDPSVYDCRAAGPPDRASPVSVGCALDPDCHARQVAGHRGAGGQLGAFAPEDTLSAYRAGIALGIEFVETDPRPTADGVLVNIHDSTVDRTTDGTGEVDQMTLEQVQALHVDAGDLPGDFSCERIPTFLDVLRTCVGRAVVLVDANKTDRVDLLVEAIEQAGAVDWAIFDTSSIDKIDEALSIDPELHIQIRPSSLQEIASQIQHFAPRLPEIVEIEAADWEQGSELVHDYGTRALSDVFIQDVQAIVTGDSGAYDAPLDAGLDILQTDRPDLVLERLRERGERG